MPRIERRPALSPTRVATGSTGAVTRKASLGLTAELATGVVLGHELDVPVLGPAIFGLVLDAHVWDLKVTADDRQIMRVGESLSISVEVAVGRPVLAVEERLVVTLQFVVEDNPSHTAALIFNALGFFLERGIQPRVVRQLPRFHDLGVEGLLPVVWPRSGVRIEQILAVAVDSPD